MPDLSGPFKRSGRVRSLNDSFLYCRHYLSLWTAGAIRNFALNGPLKLWSAQLIVASPLPLIPFQSPTLCATIMIARKLRCAFVTDGCNRPIRIPLIELPAWSVRVRVPPQALFVAALGGLRLLKNVPPLHALFPREFS